MSETPADDQGQAPAADAAEDCAECLSARGYLLAIAFAAFAAFVAADFYTGGRLSAAVAGTVAAVRGRGRADQ